MANKTQKYYWLKLEEGFFKRHDIKIIKSMPNGKDYVIFYQQLLLESLSHNGKLRFSDMIPYSFEMLATITDSNIDIVKTAMGIFQELHLVSIQDDQTIYMNELHKMIGSETEWAKKKREYRDQQKLLNSDNVETKKDNVRQEIEKEIEIDKEIECSNTNLVSNEYSDESFENEDSELKTRYLKFLEIVKEKKRTFSKTQIVEQMNELAKLKETDALKILNYSIVNGYPVLYFDHLEKKQGYKPKVIGNIEEYSQQDEEVSEEVKKEFEELKNEIEHGGNESEQCKHSKDSAR